MNLFELSDSYSGVKEKLGKVIYPFDVYKESRKA